MNVSIIIPNYNGAHLLQKNLPKVLDAVKQYKKGTFEIIIPDDPSTDNSEAVIQDFIKNIDEKNIIGKTIQNRNKKEAGFSKNVNRGVSLSTGEIIILLNSDASPHTGFLAPLLKYFTDEKVFAVGCMDESIESGKKVMRGRAIGRWERGFLIHSRGELNKHNTLWVSGGSGAFRRSIWEKLNGLDSLYNPFYWEDIDLSYRALKAGYTTVFEPASVVTHEHEEGVIKKKYKSSFVKKIAYRNQFIFVWKNITQINFLVSHFFWLPYHFIKAVIAKDLPFFAGFLLAVIKLPSIIKSRQKTKNLFMRTDSQILQEYIS